MDLGSRSGFGSSGGLRVSSDHGPSPGAIRITPCEQRGLHGGMSMVEDEKVRQGLRLESKGC